MEDICCRIECLRQRMHVTALEKGISHPDVLMISSELDKAINEFYKGKDQKAGYCEATISSRHKIIVK